MKAKKPAALVKRDPDDLAAAGIDTFIRVLGGEAKLVETLQVASSSPDVDKILTLLLDPAFASDDTNRGNQPRSLKKLCRQAGLTVADLFLAYKKANIVRAHLEASVIVREKLVKVVDDVLTRAAPYEITCTTCEGTGTVTADPTKKVPNPTPEPCKACKSTGRILEMPDLDRQKLALEVGELLQKGGLSISQQTLVQAPVQPTTTSDRLVDAVGELLFRRQSAIVDADATPAPTGTDD